MSYLKSSLDRFIASSIQYAAYQELDLKSSLDRFIEGTDNRQHRNSRFKIQFG